MHVSAIVLLFTLGVVTAKRTVCSSHTGAELCDRWGWLSEANGRYGNNEDCSLILRPSMGKGERIELVFRIGRLEEGYDFVYVYAPAESTQPLRTLTGRFSGTVVRTHETSMRIRFVSDYSVTARGYEARYRVLEGEAPVTEAPPTPTRWTMPPATMAPSTMQPATMAPSTMPPATMAPSTLTPPQSPSPTPQPDTEDRTPVDGEGMSCVDTVFVGRTGVVIAGYSNDLECTFEIRPVLSEGETLYLRFDVFDLAWHGGDRVTVYAGDMPMYSFTGWLGRGRLVRSTSTIRIRYLTSDASTAHTGFRAHYYIS